MGLDKQVIFVGLIGEIMIFMLYSVEIALVLPFWILTEYIAAGRGGGGGGGRFVQRQEFL